MNTTDKLAFSSLSTVGSRARRVLAGVALLAAGCGRAEPPAAELARTALDAALPVVAFFGDWTGGLSAPLGGGALAILHYDLSRQSGCRGPNWSVIATLTAPGHTPTILFLPGTDRTGYLERPIGVPLDSDVAFWFEGRDATGCQVWDSDFGRNFHFSPQRPERVVHLLSDFVSRIDGTLQAGQPFGVDFDLQRLPWCITRTGDGRFTGEAKMYSRFDGGAVTETSLLTPPPTADGLPGQLPVAPTLTAPSGSRSVELWFHATDSYGCTLWDSNFGGNYRFAIAP